VVAQEATLGIHNLIGRDIRIKSQRGENIVECRRLATTAAILSRIASYGISTIRRIRALPDTPIAIDKPVMQEESRIAGGRLHVAHDTADRVVPVPVGSGVAAALHVVEVGVGITGINEARRHSRRCLLVDTPGQTVVGVTASGTDMELGIGELLEAVSHAT
jgi:hypothetical protein